jgi:hypothetical protein
VDDFYKDYESLYASIGEYESNVVCCHEGDPLWRQSILNEVPNLLSLRKQNGSYDANSDADHMILSLTLRYMKFRVSEADSIGDPCPYCSSVSPATVWTWISNRIAIDSFRILFKLILFRLSN